MSKQFPDSATLAEMGENALIRRIRTGWQEHPGVRVGPGDDCAVVTLAQEAPLDLLLTSDPVTERVHFTPDADPAAVGHKAAGRVLSDIAAMGGTPRWLLLDICAPGDRAAAWVEQLAEGARSLAVHHDVPLVGGDISEAAIATVHAFGVGDVPSGGAVLRSGASPGDIVCVTGTLGGSQAGRHLLFEPRVSEGAWLRERVTAMMDLSDGLAADLPRMLESSAAGADIRLADLPVSEPARDAPDGRDAITHALEDGEDFELLFTVAETRLSPLLRAWQEAFETPCTAIGTITADTGQVNWIPPVGRHSRVAPAGYEHFHAPPNRAP